MDSEEREKLIARLKELDIPVTRYEDGIRVEIFIRDELISALVHIMEINEKLENS